MEREQQEQVKKAIQDMGADVSEKHGKDFKAFSRDALASQMLPKNTLGLSDAMVEGLYSQAYRLYNSGKYKDASQLFRLLIMIDSTDPKYTLGLAACFHMMKEWSSAISTYAMCGIIDPDNPIPHYHASDCFIQMKDPMSAIISLEMAVKRAKDKPEYQAIKDRATLTIENLKKEAKIEDNGQGTVKNKKKTKK